MNTTTPTILTFNTITLNPLTLHNQLWISASELAQALGYKQPDAVSKIYNRNQDEFGENMTQVVDNPRTPNLGVRIFSLRGCHLIAMFAKTAVAKDFRRWVLDILDKGNNHRPSTKDDREPLRHAVAALVALDNNLDYRDVYRMVHQRFGVDDIAALSAAQTAQAVEYIHTLTVTASGCSPLHGLLQEDKARGDTRQIAAIALMHTGWLRFAEHQNALEAVRRQVVGILDTLDAILSGSGAVYDGLYEAQVRLGLNSRILREGHALAESRYRPRITA